jgi:hypothetical protein
MAHIIQALPDDVIQPALHYPGFLDILDVKTLEDEALKNAMQMRM